MQVTTKMLLWNGLDLATTVATEAVPTALDKKLKTTVDSFKSFAEAPFKAEVVVYETAEDLLE
jgi:GH15 family glucan-1,4-alpha-glucosidase